MNDPDLDRMNGTHVMGCLSYRDDPDTGYPYECDCEDGTITTPTRSQHRQMHVLWREAGIAGDRAVRLAMTAAFVRRAISSSTELTPDEAHRLLEYMRAKHAAGGLAEAVDEFRARAVS